MEVLLRHHSTEYRIASLDLFQWTPEIFLSLRRHISEQESSSQQTLNSSKETIAETLTMQNSKILLKIGSKLSKPLLIPPVVIQPSLTVSLATTNTLQINSQRTQSTKQIQIIMRGCIYSKKDLIQSRLLQGDTLSRLMNRIEESRRY